MDVFIVDDDPLIVEMLCTVLEMEGFTVASASNGKLALDHIATSTDIPQALLADLTMPMMDGLTLAERVRADQHLAQIPILLMTAGYDKLSGLREGLVSAVLTKPFRMESLLHLLERYVVRPQVAA